MKKLKMVTMRFVASLLAAAMLLGLFPLGAFGAETKDIDGHWAEESIDLWLEEGLAGGYPDGTFRPNQSVTRAEFAAFANRAFSIPAAAEGAEFSDVPETAWFYSTVAPAVEAGIMVGYPDGTFRPDNPITRQEAAVILARLIENDANEKTVFADQVEIGDWAQIAVAAVSAMDIMGGYPDGTFQPLNFITRAETVVTLQRALEFKDLAPVRETVFDQPGTYGPVEGTEIIARDVVINSDGVILQNTLITGDLLLDEGLGDGDVTLQNVTVEGETVIKGGGPDSINLEDSTLSKVRVTKEGVRVVASGTTTVSIITLDSGATLVSVAENGGGFQNVVIAAGAKITLTGDFAVVTVEGTDSAVELTEGNINNLTVKAPARITGAGTITTAYIKSEGVEIKQNPEGTSLDDGLTAVVGGKTLPEEVPDPAPSTGGGGSSRPRAVAVEGINIVQGSQVLFDGEKVQLSAVIEPSNATNTDKTWTSNNEDVAVVDGNGLVTGVAEGTANITVTTVDGGFSDSIAVTVFADQQGANAAAVTAAKEAVEGATYEMTQEDATDEAAVKAAVEGIIAGLALEGVDATVVAGTYTEAVAGTEQDPDGEDGTYTFTVELTKGEGENEATATTDELTMTIFATPFDQQGANAAAVAAAKEAVEGATYEMTQEDATDEAAVKVAVEGIIAGLALEGVDATVVAGTYTEAVAGTEQDPDGEDGTYTFTVALTKGEGDTFAEDTTFLLTMNIVATPFDQQGANAAAVTAAKEAVEGATYEMTQEDATDEAAVKVAVEGIIAGLALEGVDATVVAGTYTEAVAGTEQDPDGEDGTYTFTVELTKGEGENEATATTDELTMTIFATPFDQQGANAAAVAAAKEAVEGATYEMTQEDATDEAAVKAAVEGIIAGLALEGVDATVVAGTYTEAVAGTEQDPDGEDGIYTFTVALSKGEGENEATATTTELAMTIVATPYAPPAAEGTLLDADAGSEYIGVLYKRGGNVYYNQRRIEDEWELEILMGEGTEGKLVFDSSDRPHVVYTTMDEEIGYRMYDGEAWTPVELLESNNGGECYWPDISLDTAGNPHIVYVDSMGDTVGTQMQPDVMYAYKTNGAFTKELLYSGNYDSDWKQGSYPAEKPPLLAKDGNNNRYIFYQWRTYDHSWEVYHDRGIKVDGANTQSLGSIGSNTNRFDIYDFKEVEGNLYALYRNGTNIKASVLGINTDGEIISLQDKVVFAANSAYSLNVNSNDLVIGSKDGINLRVHYNNIPNTFGEIEVAGDAVSIINVNGAFLAVYTDANDGNIQMLDIEAPPED